MPRGHVTEDPFAFLSIIKLLESSVGHIAKYALLEPFPCVTIRDQSPAIIPIQNAGRIISRHAGLGELTFIISITAQNPSTAGHIELRYGDPNVFVEISQDICSYKDAVLATLCHEVSHKFLHINGIRHGRTQLEQEFLTDVTAVYLGMGKIMLNGCECQRSYTTRTNGRVVTNTQTLRTGYISRQCFAFVYRLVCAMRQIPSDQYLSGLSEPARRAIDVCEEQYGDWFASLYNLPNGVEILSRELRREIEVGQDALAGLDYLLRRLDEKVDRLSSCLRDSHKSMLEADRLVLCLHTSDHQSAHLKFLDCLLTREAASQLIASGVRQVHGLRQECNRIEGFVEGVRSEHEIIKCPIDETKLRVPAGRNRLLVTCSSCKYKFIVTTGNDEAPRARSKRKKKGFLRSLKFTLSRR